MTLPKLLAQALQAKFGDDALRYVFPLDEWQVEAASDGLTAIVTLAAMQGMEVSFSATPATCRSLGIGLSSILGRALKNTATRAN